MRENELKPNSAVSTNDSSIGERDKSIRELINGVEDSNIKDYLNNRILPQMKWYSKMSMQYKKQYYHFTSATVIIGALIPACALFVTGPLYPRLLIAVLGSSITAINAYLTLCNSKDLWLTYRNTREILLRTLYYYFNDSEKFSHVKTIQEKNRLLVEVCEAELARENGTWRSAMEK